MHVYSTKKLTKQKNYENASLLSLAMILLLASCSVKKRVYMAGYHVEWHKSKNAVAKQTRTKSEYSALLVNQSTKAEPQIQNSDLLIEDTFVSTISNEQTASGETRAYFAPTKSANFNTVTSKPATTTSAKKTLVNAGVKAIVKQKLSKSSTTSDDVDIVLLYVLCIFIPFVAVGIVTDWDVKDVLINLLLSFLCWIPGIIHAFIKVKENR